MTAPLAERARQFTDQASAVFTLAVAFPAALYALPRMRKMIVTLPDDITVTSVYDYDHPGSPLPFGQNSQEVEVSDGEARSISVNVPVHPDMKGIPGERVIIIEDDITPGEEGGIVVLKRRQGKTKERDIEIPLDKGESTTVTKWGRIFHARHESSKEASSS